MSPSSIERRSVQTAKSLDTSTKVNRRPHGPAVAKQHRRVTETASKEASQSPGKQTTFRLCVLVYNATLTAAKLSKNNDRRRLEIAEAVSTMS